ncbi:MAG: amidohydrolase [bacterium]
MAAHKRFSSILLTLCFASSGLAQSPKPAQSSTPANAATTAGAASDLASAHNRTIYFNGKVFTSNEQHLWAEGVVVQDSLIIAVGTTQQVLVFKQPGTTAVDLKGATMIPGLNDAHVHPFDATVFPHAVLLNLATDFLPNPGPSLADILTLVRRGAAENPPGTWLMASTGTNVVEDPKTTRLALDEAAPNNPVLLAPWFGHGTAINTKAMQIVGIGEQEPNPLGGFYDRFPGSNVINGVLHEYAEHQLRRYFAGQMTDEELRTMYERFASGAARVGYTSVQEMSIGVPQARHLEVLAQSNIPIRWRAICFPLTLDEACDVPLKFSPARPFPRLTASGIKWIADGTDIERLAFLREDYADAPGVRGQPNFPTNVLDLQLKRSLHTPFLEGQPLFHTVGDATADMILDQMGAVASDAQWRLRRPRIEHGTLLRQDHYESARSKGAFVVQNPIHFALAPISAARFSPGQLADVDPMRSLLKANIKLALGSDAVVSPGNPFLDLFFALIQPTHPSEALTIEEAVIAYTRTSAAAEFQELWKGTIEPGKLADLVVLSQDIFHVAPTDIPRTQALLTIVGGKIVYDARIATAP